MNKSRKTRQQPLSEIEELGTRLDVAQQHPQEGDERLQAGMTERERDEEALGERLQFEHILSSLSARFVNIHPAQVDPEIEDGLRQILEFFRVDRCALVRTLPDKTLFQITHVASSDDVPPVPIGVKLPTTLYPWAYEKLVENHEVMSISRLDDLPAEANVDRQTCIEWGIRSYVNIPILIGEGVDFIHVNSAKSEQVWPKELLPRLRLLGEIFVNALRRREDRLKLEEQLRLETLLSEISALFVSLPTDRIEGEIENAQRRICELLDIDRSTLWQACEGDPGMLLLTNIHQPQEISPPPPRMNARDFFPWTLQKVMGGETVTISKMNDLPPEAGRDRESFLAYGTKGTVLVPLSVGEGSVFGLLGFAVTREERVWSETVVMGFKLIAQVFANALERKRMDGQLREHIREIEELKERLETENIYLHEEIRLLVEHTDIVGQSVAMKRVLAQAEQVAQTDSTVLLLGETGTGKELLARAIHSMSLRKGRPLVTVNCASLPPTLIESELFGREKGAYTGALTRMVGRFEIADGSTLFLDEIGELPLDLQSKLLRVLEDGTFERLGSTKPLHVNVRIIAATNRDIEQEVKAGKFRPDLFYRLNVFPIVIPPLRKRPEDIPLLVRVAVKEFQKRMGKEIESIPKKAMQALQSYSWPGNVRELKNLIEHAMIVSKSKTLDVHVPKQASSETNATGNLQDMERMHIVAVLEKTDWRLAGQDGAAEVLGLKRTTLQAKMKKLGIKRSNKTMPN
jgi:formate hydrogenlyase transcriptional activator